MSLWCPSPPSSLGSNRISDSEEMSFEEFQEGLEIDLGCRNRTNLKVLKLHVSRMPPSRFQLNQTYRSGADVVSIFSSWPPYRPSWTSERNNLSYSESLCCSDASHQVSTQSDFRFGRRCRLKSFKMADVAASLDIRMNDLTSSNSPCGSNVSHLIWGQSDLGFGSRCGSRYLRWPPPPPPPQPRWQSWIADWNTFSNSESLCHSNASH